MDTAKAANLFVNYPEADMYDFINAPIGRGKPIEKKLSPLVASRSPPLPALLPEADARSPDHGRTYQLKA